MAEFEVAIVRGKRDLKPVARGSAAHQQFFSLKAKAHVDLAQGRPIEAPFLRPSSRNSNWLCSR